MKTSTLLVATLLGFAIATMQGQTQSSTTTTYVQTSKIVGMKVKDSSGQEIGVVKDVVWDRNSGCMAYTVLSTGGTSTRVTGGGKTVAVPWSVYTTTSDPSMMTVRVERDRVYNAPAFDYARIDEYSTSGYINNVYSYYGVTPGVGVGVSGATTTGTVGTQTGVSGQAAATASPGVAASPAATAMASPTAASSPSATPRGTASPTGTAKATATSPASRRATATPSSEAESTGERRTHRHGESSATTSPGTSSSDEATTGRATGKRRKTTSEEGTSESGTSEKSERNKSKSELSEEAHAAEPSATP